METKNEILRICNDGKVFLHGKLVDKKDIKEVLSTLVNYVPEQEPEEELLKKGQVVWVRDEDEDRWTISHFISKKDNRYIVSDDNTGAFEDYNKFKQLTTKNPYEVEENREPQEGDMVYAWDDKKPNYVICGILHRIYLTGNLPYVISGKGCYKHCSLKNPLIK